MKEDFTIFMRDKLKLELSEEKTLITNAQDSAKFLGYEISVRKSEAMKRNKLGWLKRPFSGRIMLTLPIATVQWKGNLVCHATQLPDQRRPSHNLRSLYN